jgi:hypothetical protein
MIVALVSLVQSFMMPLSAKRRRALLASTPIEELPTGTHRGRWAGHVLSGMPYTLAAARSESGTRPRGKKQERHIGPIDSDMPEKTHSEGALIFHTATADCGEAVIDREFSKSTGER